MEAITVKELLQVNPLQTLVSLSLAQDRAFYYENHLSAYARAQENFTAFLTALASSHNHDKNDLDAYRTDPTAYLAPGHQVKKTLQHANTFLHRPVIAYACAGEAVDPRLLEPWKETVDTVTASLNLRLHRTTLRALEYRNSLETLGPLAMTCEKTLHELMALGFLKVPNPALLEDDTGDVETYLLKALPFMVAHHVTVVKTPLW